MTKAKRELRIDPADSEDLSFWKRFTSKVNFRGAAGCWEWTGRLDSQGYGYFHYQGFQEMAHRVAYAMFHGPIPAGMCVCHRCDNPACVKYDHLFLGTHADNMRDMSVKGRARGSFTEDQVLDIKAILRVPYYGVFADLARKYRVCKELIRDIAYGRTYANVGESMRWETLLPLRDAQVREIKIKLQGYKHGMSTQLAREYGVSLSMISRIRLGRAWKHIKICGSE